MNRNTTPRDLAVVPETPKLPRGILKQNEVSQKKRRVAFAGSDEQRTSSSEEGDEKQVLNFIKVIFWPYIFCLCNPSGAFLISILKLKYGINFTG